MKITNSKYPFYLGVVVFHCQYAHVLSEDDFSFGKDKLMVLFISPRGLAIFSEIRRLI